MKVPSTGRNAPQAVALRLARAATDGLPIRAITTADRAEAAYNRGRIFVMGGGSSAPTRVS